MSKYFKITGENSRNTKKMNFYRLLYKIGSNIERQHKNRIKNAIKALITNIKIKYNINISNNEIKYLIRERRTCFNNYFYKISKNSDLILKTIFEMISIIEKNKNLSISELSNGKLNQNRYCRNEIINDFDEKIEEIIDIYEVKDEVVVLQNKLIKINKTC
ncbi:MAG: hypothetical protein KAJ49_00320 [Arcobacteraceae bacterium]|nr:hypothetical protein [Arcobacteraceae bacterium]